jgi:hypothetical protein
MRHDRMRKGKNGKGKKFRGRLLWRLVVRAHLDKRSIQLPIRPTDFNGTRTICLRCIFQPADSPFESIYTPPKKLESKIDVEPQFKKMFVPEGPILAVAVLDLDLQV